MKKVFQHRHSWTITTIKLAEVYSHSFMACCESSGQLLLHYQAEVCTVQHFHESTVFMWLIILLLDSPKLYFWEGLGLQKKKKKS